MNPSRTGRKARRDAAISVVSQGTGPEELFVHGGASPETTWSGLEHLRQRWTLIFVYRRGFGPSPEPPGARQDFELDAADVLELLENRLHLADAVEAEDQRTLHELRGEAV